MRTRKEIEDDHFETRESMSDSQSAVMVSARVMVEILLDIRDLLVLSRVPNSAGVGAVTSKAGSISQ